MACLARPHSSKETPVKFSRWRGRAALLAIALAAYGNSFGLGLAQDSKAIITQDTRLQSASLENIKLILERNYWWPKSGDGLYRPMTTLSLWFNSAVLGNGPNATGYHVVNFLLHAINVWLLYELALLLFQSGGPAFFAAAIWAVHPIGTESVTSIVGRADLLAAMAVLGGLLVYVSGPADWIVSRSGDMGLSERRGRAGWGATVGLFTLATLGVFAKENAAVLIGLMLLTDLAFREGLAGVTKRWRDYAAVAASLVVLVVVRHAVLASLPPYQPVYVDNPLRGADFLTARWTAIKVLGLDLWLLVFPLALSCDRSFHQIALSGIGDPWAWISMAVVAAILAVAIRRYRQDRLVFWAVGFCGIALLPTSNLPILIGATVAERFLYLPAVAFAIAIAALLFRLTSRHATVILGTLLVLYTARTIARNPAWNDNLSLASADIPTTPLSFRLHDMLAKELFDKDARGNIDRAIEEEETSWKILAPLPPERSSSFPPTFLGLYYSTKADLVNPADQRGWYTKSLDVLVRAREISQATEKSYDQLQLAQGGLTVRVGNQQLYLVLADTEMHLGNYQDAVDALRYGQGLNPRTLELYDGLNIAYAGLGHAQMGVVSMEEKALVDGFQPATIAAIRDLYQKLPDGSCAFGPSGAQLNLTGCPRVKGDVCAAFADLARAYREARLPAEVEQVQTAATKTYGCTGQ